MLDRSPYDGRPFYCAVCSLGFGEWAACELDCALESDADAMRRRLGFRDELAAQIEVGREYSPRAGSRAMPRVVIWKGDDRVQYDGQAVRHGQHYPTMSIFAFAHWAGLTDRNVK